MGSGLVLRQEYRSWEERRQIIAAIVAETASKPLVDFALTSSEEVFFRARARRSVDRLARKTSSFKSYYRLPVAQPFLYILGLAAIIVAFGVVAALYLAVVRRSQPQATPLLAACGTLTVAAIGWCVAAWISHRNAVRQNTISTIFARFAQTAYTDSLHRFHSGFGYLPTEKVTREAVVKLRDQKGEEAKQAEAVNYVLNYFEYICVGALRGDFDAKIIKENLRGIIVYYYDKCEPYIMFANRANSRAFEHLIKVRTSYREP